MSKLSKDPVIIGELIQALGCVPPYYGPIDDGPNLKNVATLYDVTDYVSSHECEICDTPIRAHERLCDRCMGAILAASKIDKLPIVVIGPIH